MENSLVGQRKPCARRSEQHGHSDLGVFSSQGRHTSARCIIFCCVGQITVVMSNFRTVRGHLEVLDLVHNSASRQVVRKATTGRIPILYNHRNRECHISKAQKSSNGSSGVDCEHIGYNTAGSCHNERRSASWEKKSDIYILRSDGYSCTRETVTCTNDWVCLLHWSYCTLAQE